MRPMYISTPKDMTIVLYLLKVPESESVRYHHFL